MAGGPEVAGYRGFLIAGERVSMELPESYRGREQTFIKHLFLRNYLERVALNILSKRDAFVYVDGFSGPWRTKDQNYKDTSFSIAIAQLRRVRDIYAERGERKRVRCLFVERNRTAFRLLEDTVQRESQADPDIDIKALNGEFETLIPDVMQFIGTSFSLAFIDPSGWTGFDPRKIGPVLRHKPGEVIVNLMYDHINRFLHDEMATTRASYEALFGDPSWRDLLRDDLTREEAIIELYRQRLRHVGNLHMLHPPRY